MTTLAAVGDLARMPRRMESRSSEIFERVQLILRRDLKLGPDVQILHDMPFSGSDVDLDSLDILLLVTSIEKEFGIKIPSDQVGKEAFQNVGTLTTYIEQHQHQPQQPASAAAVVPSDALAKLPHQEPFRFVSRLTALIPGESAQGIWSINGNEAFFRGHFPGHPLVPGVLIGEALAQLSGIAASSAASGMLAHLDVRFAAPVAPPADILLRTARMRTMEALHQFEVSAMVDGQVVASGTLTLHLKDATA